MVKSDKLNEKQITKMRWVLFCVFASIFVIIVIGTLLVEICLDNKIRMDYSLTINGGIRGYSILVLESGLEEQDTMVGEFHLLEQAHVCGTVRLKKRLPKPKPILKR